MAAAVMALLMVILLGVTSQSAAVAGGALAKKSRQQAARAALESIARDLRVAALPLGTSRDESLAFVVNPPQLDSAYHSPASAFWQARSTRSGVGFRDLGYFIRWTGSRAALCRLVVPEGDPMSILRNTNRSINGALLDRLAPAGTGGVDDLRGLMADNVVGLWFKLFDASGAEIPLPYDSRGHSAVLPAQVEVGIAVIDPGTAAKVGTADELRGRYTASAPEFPETLPAHLRSGVQIFTTRVSLNAVP